MLSNIRSLDVGAARVSVINLGEVTLPLAPAMPRAEFTRPDEPDLRALAEQRLIPLQDILIETADTTILIDAGRYDLAPDSPYAVPGYAPPPGLAHCLAQLGVAPETVEHLVITHRHWDHFNGTTIPGDRTHIPLFPSARHYLGAGDWAAAQSAWQTAGTVESRSLGIVHACGLLEPIDGDRDLGPGVTILAAPGETPGHQIVRLESRGKVLYALGDLYHHPAEFPRPDWMVGWADPATTLATRGRLVPAALREHALLVASHIPEIGCLGGTAERPRWERVA